MGVATAVPHAIIRVMTEAASDGATPSRLTETIPQHLWHFAQAHDSLQRASDEMRGYLNALATEASIPFHSIETRPKSIASYAAKTARTRPDGATKYANPVAEIDDCVAARVIVFTTRARQDFVELLDKRCDVREHKNPGADKHNGYDSDHLVVTSLRDTVLATRYPDLVNYFRQRPGLEVQIRTVAGHAWAEYEHSIRYKSAAYRNLGENDRGRVDQWFIEAGGLRRYLDQVFNEVDEFLLPTDVSSEQSKSIEESDAEILTEDDGRELNADALIDLLKERYPGSEPGSSETIDEILQHLYVLDINTISGLEDMLARNDGNDVAGLMGYPTSVSGSRRLDDELLAALTHQYVEATSDDARKQLLRLRLRRVDGKFAIYVMEVDGRDQTAPITGARAVRELTRLVSAREGTEAVVMEGAIALSRDDLLKSTHPRVVKVAETPIYVATNLSRDSAESMMKELVSRLRNGSVRVLRAGDQIAPPLP